MRKSGGENSCGIIRAFLRKLVQEMRTTSIMLFRKYVVFIFCRKTLLSSFSEPMKKPPLLAQRLKECGQKKIKKKIIRWVHLHTAVDQSQQM